MIVVVVGFVDDARAAREGHEMDLRGHDGAVGASGLRLLIAQTVGKRVGATDSIADARNGAGRHRRQAGLGRLDKDARREVLDRHAAERREGAPRLSVGRFRFVSDVVLQRKVNTARLPVGQCFRRRFLRIADGWLKIARDGFVAGFCFALLPPVLLVSPVATLPSAVILAGTFVFDGLFVVFCLGLAEPRPLHARERCLGACHLDTGTRRNG